MLLGIKSNILSLYDKKDITENFIIFFEKYYYDIHFINKLLLLSPYLGYIKPVYHKEKLNELLISYNCILFNLKMFLKKKQKLKIITNTVRLKPLMKELSAISTSDLSKAVFKRFTLTNKQKFNNIPPYSVYPKLLENMRCGIMIREKADGVTVNSLPDNIYPSIQQTFINPETGQFDKARLIQYLKEDIYNDETGDALDRWLQFEKAIVKEKLNNKFINLVSKGLFVSDWENNVINISQNEIRNISFLEIPFKTIDDSLVSR